MMILEDEVNSWIVLFVLIILTLFVMQIDSETDEAVSVKHNRHTLNIDRTYVWWPERVVPGSITVYIDTAIQEVFVYCNDTMVGWAITSTGKRGKDTPLGTFRILNKQKMYKSKRYADAPMPYMQRLTDDGVAMHGGLVPNYPASHGCIRLPIQFAKLLYAVTDSKTYVEIY